MDELCELWGYCSWITNCHLHSSNKSNELKEALELEMEKTRLMEETIKKIDEELRRSDDLLSQMIPQAVAEKVKSGFNPVETCEVRLHDEI